MGAEALPSGREKETQKAEFLKDLGHMRELYNFSQLEPESAKAIFDRVDQSHVVTGYAPKIEESFRAMRKAEDALHKITDAGFDAENVALTGKIREDMKNRRGELSSDEQEVDTLEADVENALVQEHTSAETKADDALNEYTNSVVWKYRDYLNVDTGEVDWAKIYSDLFGGEKAVISKLEEVNKKMGEFIKKAPPGFEDHINRAIELEESFLRYGKQEDFIGRFYKDGFTFDCPFKEYYVKLGFYLDLEKELEEFRSSQKEAKKE